MLDTVAAPRRHPLGLRWLRHLRVQREGAGFDAVVSQGSARSSWRRSPRCHRAGARRHRPGGGNGAAGSDLRRGGGARLSASGRSAFARAFARRSSRSPWAARTSRAASSWSGARPGAVRRASGGPPHGARRTSPGSPSRTRDCSSEIEEKGPAARGRQPAQVGVPRQHVARAAHAAQRHHRLLGGAARADVRRAQREAGRVPRRHPGVGPPLLSLINDILDLSKIEAGRMELELARFDLPARHRQRPHARAGARPAPRHRRSAWTSDRASARSSGDERKVKQVMLNLLSNAVKFTPEGGRVQIAREPRPTAAWRSP